MPSVTEASECGSFNSKEVLTSFAVDRLEVSSNFGVHEWTKVRLSEYVHFLWWGFYLHTLFITIEYMQS